MQAYNPVQRFTARVHMQVFLCKTLLQRVNNCFKEQNPASESKKLLQRAKLLSSKLTDLSEVHGTRWCLHKKVGSAEICSRRDNALEGSVSLPLLCFALQSEMILHIKWYESQSNLTCGNVAHKVGSAK